MFRKLRDALMKKPVDKPQRPQIGRCDICDYSFAYDLCHCGFADMGYAYCERCGQTALLSGWFKGIPPAAQLRIHQAISIETEPHLEPCNCGGTFRCNASPRCPRCLQALSPDTAARWIEANAPGTLKGWRWQRNWSDVYAIVIEGHRVCNNWRAQDER